MKTWTPSELEEGLLDYLYDELEPEERRSFEHALASRPDLTAELERHRLVRSAAGGLAAIPMPTSALQTVLVAADAEAERRRHAALEAGAGGAGFWARLRGWLLHPAFAMASVALIVAGVGLSISQNGTHIGERRDDQSVPAKPREAVVVPPTSGQAVKADAPHKTHENEGTEAAVPKDDVATQLSGTKELADPAPVVAPPAPARSGTGRATTSGAGDEALVLERVRDAKPTPFGPRDEGQPSGAAVHALVEADAAKPAERLKENHAEAPAAPFGVVNGGSGLANEKQAESVADTTGSDAPTKVKDAPPVEPKAKTDALDGAKAPERAPPGNDDSASARSENGKAQNAPATPPNADKRVVEEGSRELSKVAAQPDSNANPGRSNVPAPKAADDKNNAQTRTAAGLWTTYGQQMAAGAWSDAAKTLSEIDKLGSDAERVQRARAELKKRAPAVAEEPAKENASKLPDPGLKPTPDTKVNRP